MINTDCGKNSISLMKLLISVLRTPSGTLYPDRTFVSKFEFHPLAV
jgi:hypothetical protein